MAQQAREFLRAAQREFDSSRPKALMVGYFLAARAIELGLKSFLLLRGRSERELRTIGHDLNKAFDEAAAASLRDVAEILPEHEAALRWVNAYYQLKDLEYVTTGPKSYPAPEVLVACADRILNHLDPELRRWRPSGE
jgi:HEPN domain-containing protein